MTQRLRVCALLPAYNEADIIEATIVALLNHDIITSIVIVDDGSTDDTFEIASRISANVMAIKQSNAGKGAALTRAYAEARDTAEIFLLLDSDLGASASEAIKLLHPVLSDEADMTIGMLPPDPTFAASNRSGGMGFVVRLARWGIKQAAGLECVQPLSGQRAVRREVIESFGGRFAAGFGVEVDLTIKTVRSGYRVVEIPTYFRHRVTSSDMPGIVHRARQFIDVARVVARSTKVTASRTVSPVPGD